MHIEKDSALHFGGVGGKKVTGKKEKVGHLFFLIAIDLLG